MSVVPFRPARQEAPAADQIDIGAVLDAIRQAAGALQGVRLSEAVAQIERRYQLLPVAEPRLAMDDKASAEFHATAAMLKVAALFQLTVAEMGPHVMGADNAAV